MSSPFYKKNTDFPWQVMHGETIIVDPVSQNSFELNAMGTFIWSRIDGQTSHSQIQEQICAEFDVTPETVEDDLQQITSQLLANKLIVPRSS